MFPFLSLPRELRDMIYTNALLYRLPIPTPQSLSPSSDSFGSPWSLYDPYDPNPAFYHDHNGIHFSIEPPPNTCANLLATNRQINREVTGVIERVRRKGQLLARMDCLVLYGPHELEHYISWVSVPLIKSATTVKNASEGSVGKWAPIVRRLGGWGTPVRYGVRSADWDEAQSKIVLEGLCVDVRLTSRTLKSGTPAAAAQQISAGGEQTMWAVCAALKKALRHDFENKHVSIELLILNVIPAPTHPSTPPDPHAPPHSPRSRSLTSPNSTSPSSSTQVEKEKNMAEAKKVAGDLVALWNKIWARDGADARCYRSLLERIQRVRACVDGRVVKERDLGLELERGQMERRRIAMRVGW